MATQRMANTIGRQKIFFVPEETRPGIVEDVFECLNNLGYVWRSGDKLNIFFEVITSKHFMDVVYGQRKAFLELRHSDTYHVVFCDDIEECEEVYCKGDWVSAEDFLELNREFLPNCYTKFTVGEEFDNVNNLF